jgi:succinoglycan biosynthesis protein ExoA
MNVPVSVSVVIPCRNERRHIEACLRSVLAQEPPEGGFEIIVADGMSDDGTRDVLSRIASEDPRLRVIDNRQGIVPTGLNAAIMAARGDIIIRMDAHTDYAPDYICKCVAALAETRADNVGGPARTKANSYLQEAICLAYHHPFSCGGAQFHNTSYEGYVDTVTYGCWKKTTLLAIGLFDEELVRNQDDELNLRLVRSGGKIWQSPAIQSWYYPRASFSALFRQYAQYGYWKVRVLQKHKIPASIRHLVPGAFVGSAVILAMLAPFSNTAAMALALLAGLYCIGNLAAACHACLPGEAIRFLPVMPAVFAAYHFGYGYGFLRGMIDFWFRDVGKGEAFTRLTREVDADPPPPEPPPQHQHGISSALNWKPRS